MMRRALLFVVLLMGFGVSCLGVDLREIGIAFTVSHDPLLVDGRVRFSSTVSLYGKLEVSEAWMLRATVGSPLGLWMPYAALATTHAIGSRWAAEAELSMRTAGDMVSITLSAGGRVAVAATPTTRWMVSSFPIGVSALYFVDAWTMATGFVPNLAVDVSWAPASPYLVGQSIAVSLIRFTGISQDAALPLGDEYGLRFQSVTRAGFRP